MENEIKLSSEKPVFSRWQPAAWLRVSGEDAFSFLQGQFTNDLRQIGERGGIYGLWLNHKGRVLADSFVLRGPAGDFWIGSYFSRGDVIRERLEAFIIADDVVVEDVTADWRAVSVLAPGSSESLMASAVNAVGFAGRRSGLKNHEWVFPAASETTILSQIRDGTELGAAELELLRIKAGIPAVPADIGPGELPNEGGLDAVAISYNKGCYLGQEVMARLKSMGQVRRRLFRVRGSRSLPPLPAALHQGGRRIGELRTAAATAEGFVGMALLSLIHFQAGAGLSFSAEGEATMSVEEPT